MTFHHSHHCRSREEQLALESIITYIFEHNVKFNEVIGFRIESFDPKNPKIAFDMRQELVGTSIYNRLHGGVIATALDTVAGFALALAIAEKYSGENPEQVVTRFSRFGTIDLRVDYLHQGIGKSFHAGANILRLGGRIASVRMELKNDEDILIAAGTAAYVVS